jgi:hypothetical protein
VSFQAYLDSIQRLTNKTPDMIYQEALKAWIIQDHLTATEWLQWLLNTYDLKRGHSMALWNYFIDKGWIKNKHTTIKKS